jgi:hypothetical protein
VGFLSRLLIPRGVRRATHPVRTVKRAVTPKPVKKVQRAMHPIDNAIYSVERSVSTSIRNGVRGSSGGSTAARATPGIWALAVHASLAARQCSVFAAVARF